MKSNAIQVAEMVAKEIVNTLAPMLARFDVELTPEQQGELWDSMVRQYANNPTRLFCEEIRNVALAIMRKHEAESRMANDIIAEYRAAQRDLARGNNFAELSAENDMHALAKMDSIEAWL